MLLELLEKNIRRGTLQVRFRDGTSHRFGQGSPSATWVLRDRRTCEKIARNYALQLGETYMDGAWEAEDADLPTLLSILRGNFTDRRPPRYLLPLLYLVQQWNNVTASLRNVARHYDLDQQLFEQFLDPDLHYSCAYFEHPADSLEQAQLAKCRHVARKLLLRPGDEILDIGCGWGGLALHLAQQHDVRVTGITLSRDQYECAVHRARERGIRNVDFALRDYREHTGRYDRIVSIGMFEHVGRPYYRRFYRKLHSLLRPEGVALIHSIGTSAAPAGPTNPWIRRHIFPGGAIPALSEMSAAAEQEEFLQADIETLRLHYAWTLHHWYRRFTANRPQIAARMGERFCRMWEFYLAICEASFAHADLVVYQQQLAVRHGSVPITRDYLYARPVAHAAKAPREGRMRLVSRQPP